MRIRIQPKGSDALHLCASRRLGRFAACACAFANFKTVRTCCSYVCVWALSRARPCAVHFVVSDFNELCVCVWCVPASICAHHNTHKKKRIIRLRIDAQNARAALECANASASANIHSKLACSHTHTHARACTLAKPWARVHVGSLC